MKRESFLSFQVNLNNCLNIKKSATIKIADLALK